MKDKTIIAGMEFDDISSEEYREYVYSDAAVVRIDAPTLLHVRPSGSHRLVDAVGVSHRIEPGFKDVRWKPKAGEPSFVL
jgi:hypothetical protein